MDKERIIELATEMIRGSEDNVISEAIALGREVVGLKLFDNPIFAFGSADDPCFQDLKDGDANLQNLLLPAEWLPGAKTVISFFLPFSQAVKDSNKNDFKLPSAGWLHGRIEGQALLNKLTAYIEKELTRAGYKSLAPLLDERSWNVAGPDPHGLHPESAFTSNWSERHAAYVCGLGTFGLSKGLITAKGVAGRFGSVITQLHMDPDVRPYTGIYDYCCMCGDCIKNCPVGAISQEKGKLHAPCSDFLDFTAEKYKPRYGCGKCQVGVPCESRIPNL